MRYHGWFPIVLFPIKRSNRWDPTAKWSTNGVILLGFVWATFGLFVADLLDMFGLLRGGIWIENGRNFDMLG